MKYALILAAAAGPAFADAPIVEAVKMTGGRVDVTLSHPDTGWDHYADGWEVLDGDGNSLGIRELAHPHVSEQPFTRSLTGLTLPKGATEIYIRARCNVDGWSDTLFPVVLPN